MEISDALFYAHTPSGLILTDVDGTILRANAIFARWLGYEVADIEGVVKFQQLLTVGARIFHQTHWQPLMQLQASVSEVKLDFRHASGHRVPMLVNAQTCALPDGRSCYSIAVSVAADRDRYERELLAKRTEAVDLLRKHRLLEDQAVERGQFAEQLIGIVSHDLRNPLTAIRMGTEMLVLDEEDPKRLKLAARIQQSVDRALSLIEDLLDFTLTKTGRALPTNQVEIDLHEIVAWGVEELRWSFPGAVIVHRVEGPGAVKGDSGQLTRVLGNLVANAVRYGDAAQPIVVSSRIRDGLASLFVRNAGPPIPAAILPNIFQAMTRGDPRQGGGVGLGLYIVSQIALAHGGHPRASSDPQAGTCMGIEFPSRAAGPVADMSVHRLPGISSGEQR